MREDEVISNPIAFAKRQNENLWLEMVAPNKKTSLQSWVNGEEMIQHMKQANVDKSVLLGWYWENPDTCVLQNDWCANWIKENANKFFGFVSIHPHMQNPVEELKKRSDQGFSGIGECHPWAQDSSPRSENWIKCMEFANNLGWPVTYHVTEPVGHEYPGRINTPFEDLLWLVRKFPELKIILAHAGGLFPFYELNPKIRHELKNVFYDLAACPLLYEPSIYRKLIEVVNHEKILWGTDYPLRIFPKSQKEPDFSSFKDFIRSKAKLNDSEQNAIFGYNFLSLLSC